MKQKKTVWIYEKRLVSDKSGLNFQATKQF